MKQIKKKTWITSDKEKGKQMKSKRSKQLHRHLRNNYYCYLLLLLLLLLLLQLLPRIPLLFVFPYYCPPLLFLLFLLHLILIIFIYRGTRNQTCLLMIPHYLAIQIETRFVILNKDIFLYHFSEIFGSLFIYLWIVEADVRIKIDFGKLHYVFSS